MTSAKVIFAQFDLIVLDFEEDWWLSSANNPGDMF